MGGRSRVHALGPLPARACPRQVTLSHQNQGWGKPLQQCRGKQAVRSSLALGTQLRLPRVVFPTLMRRDVLPLPQ